MDLNEMRAYILKPDFRNLTSKKKNHSGSLPINILLRYVVHFLIFNLVLSSRITLHYSKQRDVVIFFQRTKKYKTSF